MKSNMLNEPNSSEKPTNSRRDGLATASCSPDSGFVYITSHVWNGVYNLMVLAVFGWLYLQLNNGWIFLGASFFVRSYHHDFNSGCDCTED